MLLYSNFQFRLSKTKMINFKMALLLTFRFKIFKPKSKILLKKEKKFGDG